MNGPCVKQRVLALIRTENGETFTGENDCITPQSFCPRANMKSGEGYELCSSICNQTGHAEINALQKAGEKAKGATLYLKGHTYVCDNCKKTCDDAGIVHILLT